MSSGSNVPYHMRPNKFVERQLFLEVLEKIARVNPLSGYAYISMGGRFLEDFKVIHTRFAMTKLVSIESEWLTYDRQVFNRPLALIRCINKASGEFITNFSSLSNQFEGSKFIIWLDYAAADKRREQLQEFQSLIGKLSFGDIVKITLNANPQTLGSSNAGTQDAVQKGRFERIKAVLGDFFPEGDFDHTYMTPEGLCRVLTQAIKKVALDGLLGLANSTFLPLAQFRYNDSQHQMLTVTGIVIATAERDAFLADSLLGEWRFLPESWEDVHEIAVPDLSIKERIELDGMLFAEPAEQAHARLPFKFDADNEESLRSVEQYVVHYNRYPSFLRVTM